MFLAFKKVCIYVIFWIYGFFCIVMRNFRIFRFLGYFWGSKKSCRKSRFSATFFSKCHKITYFCSKNMPPKWRSVCASSKKYFYSICTQQACTLYCSLKVSIFSPKFGFFHILKCMGSVPDVCKYLKIAKNQNFIKNAWKKVLITQNTLV